MSWYADGVRVVDPADPRHPREVAAFEAGGGITSVNVWGVALSADVVLVSDIGRGPYVLRMTAVEQLP